VIRKLRKGTRQEQVGKNSVPPLKPTPPVAATAEHPAPTTAGCRLRCRSLGTPGNGADPDKLFAAGWSACFLSATKLVAGKRKIALPAKSGY